MTIHTSQYRVSYIQEDINLQVFPLNSTRKRKIEISARKSILRKSRDRYWAAIQSLFLLAVAEWMDWERGGQGRHAPLTLTCPSYGGRMLISREGKHFFFAFVVYNNMKKWVLRLHGVNCCPDAEYVECKSIDKYCSIKLELMILKILAYYQTDRMLSLQTSQASM